MRWTLGARRRRCWWVDGALVCGEVDGAGQVFEDEGFEAEAAAARAEKPTQKS